MATLRVLSVGFAAYGVAALPLALVTSVGMTMWETTPGGPGLGFVFLASVLHPATYLATGGVLWALAEAVADRIVPSIAAADLPAVEQDGLAALLFSGVGAFALVIGASELSYHGYMSWALARDGLEAAYSHQNAASCVSAAIKAGLGLSLLLGARGWAGAIRRLRRLSYE